MEQTAAPDQTEPIAPEPIAPAPAAAALPDESPAAAELDYPIKGPPPGGTTLEVAPGVRWVRMPLPFRLDHINLWLLEDGPGWTVVDTGIGSEKTRQIWRQVFADTLNGRPITRVICTHFHPDHMGLAGWFAREWNVKLWATRMEWLWCRMLCIDESEAMIEGAVRFYARAGMDGAGQEAVRARGNGYRKGVVTPPTSLHAIGAGDVIAIGGRDWHVHIGSGHSPEHACLYCPELDVLISGDQVLPRISPNVSVWASEPEDDPLARFLDSLERLRAVPNSAFVLPSHGLPFRGLHARLDQLAEHHAQHFQEVLDACTDWRSARDISRVMFRPDLDPQQLVFAVGESLAHLHYLVGRGRLTQRMDADGVVRFIRGAT
ncbi:MAG: MBL fold metallo-hydrolase [Alphaproteobacteria bacterium]|nr:MBL fold metallo-hydrolase [Alphaproteobacteria bacterium]